jgi:predicted amidohydrolase
MSSNAEPLPDGPLCQAVISMSKELNIAICVGIAELGSDLQVYNSQFVVDRGKFLGVQRKINLSGDEYQLPAADIPCGLVICQTLIR